MNRTKKNLIVIMLAFVLSLVGIIYAFNRPLPATAPVGSTVVQTTDPVKTVTLAEADAQRIALAKSVSTQVVNIYLEESYRGQKVYVGGGSGVIYREDAENYYILTNYHVASAGSIVSVLFDKKTVPTKLLGGDETVDLAVLSLSKADVPAGFTLTVAKLGDSKALQAGETVLAVGNALGFGQSITQGIVSAVGKNLSAATEFAYSLIQTDAPINPGNSGGALINMQGEVVGINTLKIAETGVEGIGFAIPINQASKIAETLRTQGYLPKAFLGVGIVEMDQTNIYQPGVPQGVVVMTVSPDSPAAKAGIRINDLIVRIGEVATTSGDLFRSAIWSHSPNETVQVQLFRKGEPLTVDVTFSTTKK